MPRFTAATAEGERVPEALRQVRAHVWRAFRRDSARPRGSSCRNGHAARSQARTAHRSGRTPKPVKSAFPVTVQIACREAADVRGCGEHQYVDQAAFDRGERRDRLWLDSHGAYYAALKAPSRIHVGEATNASLSCGSSSCGCSLSRRNPCSSASADRRSCAGRRQSRRTVYWPSPRRRDMPCIFTRSRQPAGRGRM
jgi:hypothetical protein